MSLEKVTISKVRLERILTLRRLFLQQNRFQIRYNAYHERGWSDSYLIGVNGDEIGYGSVKGMKRTKDRDSVFEYYLIPSFQEHAREIFITLADSAKAIYIECQTNELLLTSMLETFCRDVHSDSILFEAGMKSNLRVDDTIFRNVVPGEKIFNHEVEPVGQYCLEVNSEIIATGGYFRHYNFPFADLFMEVREDHRRKGFGSFLIQEIKNECYKAGLIPAARCNENNIASKNTLMKAGMSIAGYLRVGEIGRW